MAAPHTLATGEYLIQMHAGSRLYLGVDQREPITVKNVVALPGGVQAPKWTIQQYNESQYVIKEAHLGTIAEGTSVVALETQTPVQWLLTHYPQQGAHCYMISNMYPGPTQGHAWVVENGSAWGNVALKDIGFFAPELPPKEALFDLVPASKAAAPHGGAATTDAPHTLADGEFLIQMHSGSRLYLGVDERKPISIKDVVALPGGVQAPKWTIQKYGESSYVIKESRLGTIAQGQRVVALETNTPVQWLLTWYPQQGPHCYMITDVYPGPTQGHAWVVEDGSAWGAVVLKDIGFFAPELPPPQALFNLVPVPTATAATEPTAPAAPAQIAPGNYLIRKHKEGPYVAVDNGGADPHRVFVLPGGTRAPVWSVQEHDGRWSIAEGTRTAFPDGRDVRAGTIFNPWQWLIQPVLGRPNCYVVFTASPVQGKTLAWELSKNVAYTPIELRDLGMKIPEIDPPEEVMFDFVPVPKDSE